MPSTAELPWRAVRSSNVARLAWVGTGIDTPDDEPLGSLYVEWLAGGRTSRYRDVTERMAQDVIEAGSVGRALNTLVKSICDHEYIETGDR